MIIKRGRRYEQRSIIQEQSDFVNITWHILYEQELCTSEFIEKAILFYIGYLSQQDNLNYISPMITKTVKAQINDTEQRLARLLFKVAVELGKLTHLLAAANDVDDEMLRQLFVMCINEVRKTNGVIDCEDAVRYQKE